MSRSTTELSRQFLWTNPKILRSGPQVDPSKRLFPPRKPQKHSLRKRCSAIELLRRQKIPFARRRNVSGKSEPVQSGRLVRRRRLIHADLETGNQVLHKVRESMKQKQQHCKKVIATEFMSIRRYFRWELNCHEAVPADDVPVGRVGELSLRRPRSRHRRRGISAFKLSPNRLPPGTIVTQVSSTNA